MIARPTHLALALLVGMTLGGLSCRSPSSARSGADASNARDDELEPMLPPLEKTDVVVGKGAAAKTGDTVVVHYVGRLEDGTVFDDSHRRGTPLEFTLGGGTVIPGWEIGVVGMQPGGRRELIVPPHLGYGRQGHPPRIPPEATLHFDVELLEVR